MLHPRWLLALLLVMLAACAVPPAEHTASTDPAGAALAAIPQLPHTPLCRDVPAGHGRCFAHVRTDAAGKVVANAAPQGYGPPELQSAYAVPPGGAGRTVAIVDAYDDPRAETDLAAYRAQYGLPPCTTANGCFHKVDQSGGSSYP
ncbi:MAG: peptidase S8, partial [Polyangiaceae bacterium]